MFCVENKQLATNLRGALRAKPLIGMTVLSIWRYLREQSFVPELFHLLLQCCRYGLLFDSNFMIDCLSFWTALAMERACQCSNINGFFGTGLN